jgi:hypothetical protein
MTPEAKEVVKAFKKNIELHYDYRSIVGTLTDSNDESDIADVLSEFYNEEFFRIKFNGYCSPLDLVSASGLIVSENKTYAAGSLKQCNHINGGAAVSLHKVEMLRIATGAIPPRYKVADTHFARYGIYACMDAYRFVWTLTLDKIGRAVVASMDGALKIGFNSKFGPNKGMNIERGDDPAFQPVIFIPVNDAAEKIANGWRCIGRKVDGKVKLFNMSRRFEEFEMFAIWRKRHQKND